MPTQTIVSAPEHAPGLEEAYQHCQSIAREHYENFPTASLLIRPELRPAVAAIYSFARHADDLADEGDAAPEIRLKQIDAWEHLLERAEKDEVEHPVFLALGNAIRRFGLPVDALHNLLVAFRMDVSIHSYATADELLFYCKHSANPVGRLMLALHGIHDPVALRASDAICSALQLTNFWQDLSIDLPRGRCYLPKEWLSACGFSHTDLLEGHIDSAALAPALCQATDYTAALYEKGYALLPYLPLRLRLQIAATLQGGKAILRKTAATSDPFTTRPKLGSFDWLLLIPRVLTTALMPRPRPGTQGHHT